MEVTKPIEHPSITIPTKGTFTVKFGLGAQYTLEKEMGVSMEDVGRRLLEAVQKPDASGEMQPGRVSPAFLLDVLSACVWDQVHLKPRELADCFETLDSLREVARVVMVAFTKTRWSAQPLQEPATTQELAPIN